MLSFPPEIREEMEKARKRTLTPGLLPLPPPTFAAPPKLVAATLAAGIMASAGRAYSVDEAVVLLAEVQTAMR